MNPSLIPVTTNFTLYTSHSLENQRTRYTCVNGGQVRFSVFAIQLKRLTFHNCEKKTGGGNISKNMKTSHKYHRSESVHETLHISLFPCNTQPRLQSVLSHQFRLNTGCGYAFNLKVLTQLTRYCIPRIAQITDSSGGTVRKQL